MLTVTTPAASRDILTLPELKAAVGVTDPSQDAAIGALKLRLEAAISYACHVAPAGTAIPTLRSETLTETQRFACGPKLVQLARRPITAVNSVTENGGTLAATDYEIEATIGALRRLDTSDNPIYWQGGGKIVVQYIAGWDIVPDDLKLAASKLAWVLWNEQQREPGVRRESIPDVRDVEFWVAPTSDPLIDQEVLDLLGPYRNWVYV